MAIVKIQTTTLNWSSGSSFNGTVSAIGSGDTSVIGIYVFNFSGTAPTVSSVTGGTGATWTRAGTAYVPTSTTLLDIWYGTGATGGGTSVVVNLSGTPTFSGAAFFGEFSGIATSSALDQTGNVAGASGTGMTNALTGSAASDLQFGLIFDTGDGVAGTTPTPPWSIVGSVDADGLAGGLYTIGNPGAGSWSGLSGDEYYSRAASFMAATAAPSYVPPTAHRSFTPIHRASSYFARIPWQTKRSGLAVPGFATASA